MTITKKSHLLKLNFKITALLLLSCINVSMLSAQDLTIKQKDSTYLLNPRQERIRKIKKSFDKKSIL
jgi:hypothetical protein